MGISVFPMNQMNGAVETWQPLTQTLTWCISFWAWFTEMTCGNFCGWPKFEILTHIDTNPNTWPDDLGDLWCLWWPQGSPTRSWGNAPHGRPQGLDGSDKVCRTVGEGAGHVDGHGTRRRDLDLETLKDVERRWKTLKDVGKAAKPWKRLEKIEKSTAGQESVLTWRKERSWESSFSYIIWFLLLRNALAKFSSKEVSVCPMVVPWLSHGCTGLLVFRNQMQRIRWFCLVPWETGKFSLPSCRWAEGCFVIKVSGWRHANFHNGTVRQEKNGINERPTEVLWYVMVVTLEKHGCMSFWNTVGRWSAWFGCPKSQNSKQRRLWRVEKAGQWRRSRWSRMAAEVPA